MRLTANGRLYVPMGKHKASQTSVNHYHYVDMYNKLADLEDIEEELGIDLITLFKALKQGAYFKNEKETFYFRVEFENMVNASFVIFNEFYSFKDYGKSWALTKEELEK